ncbi:unnamed protein product [Caenorhabditis brenneri]
MSWNDQVAERSRLAESNGCRDLLEVPTGTDYHIRKLMEEYPQFLWKYSEGMTIPHYLMKIANQLEAEFCEENCVPIDLYPCEYFRIMEHSEPTELALQPKRFDRAQEQLSEKLQNFYADNAPDLVMPNKLLMPRIACAVFLQNKWYRGRLENVPTAGIWAYVYLVDFGLTRQVIKADVRFLPINFGHYPPMVVKATIRGAFIQRMDYNKIEKFKALIKDLGYLARCQITTTSEPFHVNMCHPNYEQLNVCSFLLAPRFGPPSEAGIWLPKKIAKDLNRENGIESDEKDDSGADSDFNDSDEEADNAWDFDEETDNYMRSYPPAAKAFRVMDNDFQVERIENEHLIYLTNHEMREKRREAEEYLTDEIDSLEELPEVWIVYGTACVVVHEGVPKRAAINNIGDSSLELLLIDYGIPIESNASKVFSLPNEPAVNMEPQVTLIAFHAFNSVHYSRVEILRHLLPRGTAVRFERERRSKEVPTKGTLFLSDNTSVEQRVIECVTDEELNLECLELVPYCESSDFRNQLLSDRINLNFMYKCTNAVIYKKSKFVTCQF